MTQISVDRLTGLVAFARAASLGSYTAAATALGVTPSAVSRSVKRLEDRLGLRLFHRTTRSLTLTTEGSDLHDRASRLLREAEAIEQAAFAARAEPAGLLRVTAPLPVGVHVLSPVLPAFRELYPRIAIDLRLDDRFTDLVSEGIDVALRVGDLSDSQLVSRRLAPHRVCAFASRAYLARRGIPRTPDELATHDCVCFRFRSSGHVFRWQFSVRGRLVELAPTPAVIADTSEAVAAICAAGGGIAMSPTMVAAPYVQRRELVPVLLEHAVTRTHLTALTPEGRRSNPNVKAFLKFLESKLASPPRWDVIVDRAKHRGRR
jgi:DNA-binding transcriptional LysR family regulator